MQVFKSWLKLATTEEIDELATAADTSRAYLHALASDGRTYSREASNAMAIRIEKAAAPISARSGGRLPRVLRTDLNAGCRGCEYAEKCLGQAAIASHFRVVE